jgi:quercetin dioxygenase-like cupin family protein
MVKVSVYANAPLSNVNSTKKASLRTFNLPILIRKMKYSDAWAKGELNSMILMKNRKKQIMLTAIQGGTEIVSFQSNDSITFQIIEGKLLFHTRKESVILNKGHFLTLHDNINYSLTTKEETVFLLTIEKSTLHHTENN